MRWFVLASLCACGRLNFDARTDANMIIDAPPTALGELDPTFGNGGIALFDEGENEIVVAIGTRRAGYMLVGNRGLVARVDALALSDDGSVDRMWGAAGTLATPPTGYGTAVFSDTDRMLLAGIKNGGLSSDVLVVAVMADGMRDASFGNNGEATVDIAGDDFAYDLVRVGDLSVACGASNEGIVDTAAALIGFDATGALAPSFGIGGIVSLDDTTARDACDSIVATSTELIITGVRGGLAGAARFTLDGTLLSSMSIGMTGGGNSIVVAPDGAIYVAVDDAGNPVVMKLHADLSPDLSFGNQGAAALGIAGGATVHDIVLQSDGTIVGVGVTANAPEADGYFARWRPDGTLDPTFGVDGIMVVDLPNYTVALTALVVDPLGRLVAGGTYISVNLQTIRPLVVRLR